MATGVIVVRYNPNAVNAPKLDEQVRSLERTGRIVRLLPVRYLERGISMEVGGKEIYGSEDVGEEVRSICARRGRDEGILD